MPKFNFVRLSLSTPAVGPLLSGADDRLEPDIPRAEFLSSAFAQRRDFFHRGRLVTYVPGPPEAQQEELIVGYFGKKLTQSVNEGPDHLYRRTTAEFHRASVIAVDLRSDRQIVAFEKRSDLGDATALLESFFYDFARVSTTFQWHVDCEFISESRDFWSAVNQHRGEITEVVFEFFPANGVTGFDSFKSFDKTAKNASNADRSKYSLQNLEGGLVPAGSVIEEAVEYAHEGAGRVKLMRGRRVLYNGRESRIEMDVAEDVMPREVETVKFLGLALLLFSGLKR